MGYLGNAPADQAVQIGDGVVDTDQLAADAVTSAKIADGQVDTEHLAALAVETAKIGADAVTNAKVADGEIDTEHLAADAVTSAKVSDGTITADDINSTFLQPIKSDISALALREATNESSAAFNLPNQFIETFTDDTNLGTQTTGLRTSGYWASGVYVSAALVATRARIYVGGSNNVKASWKLQGSNDNSSYTDLSTEFGGNMPPNAWYNSNAFSNSTAYRYYRLDHTGTTTGGGWYHRELELEVGGSWYTWSNSPNRTVTSAGSAYSGAGVHVVDLSKLVDNNTSENVFHTDLTTGDTTVTVDLGSGITINATGTLIQSANTVGSAKTKVGGVIFYKDNAGTATLGTDLKIYFSCNNGGAWTEAASYNAITPVYSTGIKQVRLGETTCTSGTGVIYKAVWANQAGGSKETQLHGIGINY